MKNLLVAFSLFLVIGAKAQYIPVVDTSFHPIIDTSVRGITACQIQPIKAVLSNDTATLVSIASISDNLSNLANISFSFLKSDLSPMKSYTFTLQGANYTNWQNNGNEYLFQSIATLIQSTYGLRINFL